MTRTPEQIAAFRKRYKQSSIGRRTGEEARRRRESIWKCPGCGRVALTAYALSQHLALAGDLRASCPVVRAEWAGQTKLDVTERDLSQPGKGGGFPP